MCYGSGCYYENYNGECTRHGYAPGFICPPDRDAFEQDLYDEDEEDDDEDEEEEE